MPYITLLIFVIFCSMSSNAQNFIYSDAIGNYPYTNFKLIGQVKNNIVAFKYTDRNVTDMRKAEVLVYNTKLKLLNKISFKSITRQLATINFVNEGSTFAAIIQYHENGMSICKMVSFDSNGKIIKTQILEHSVNSNDDNYVIIRSISNKKFALLKVIPSNINKTIAIRYFLVSSDSLIYSDNAIIPFDTLTCDLNKALLDDNNLLVCVTNSLNNDERIGLHKIDLTNNSSVNTFRDVKNGYFEKGSLDIHSNDKYYMVTGNWANNQDTVHNIYLWHLNKDLTDVTSDTVFSPVDTITTCLQHIYYYNVNSIILNDNTADVVISANKISRNSIQLYSPGYGGTYFTGNVIESVGGGFYTGRVLSMVPQKELNSNGYYANSNVGGGPLWYNNSSSSPYYSPLGQVIKSHPQEAIFGVFNFDEQNNLKWSRCFNESTNKDIKYLLNEAVYISTTSGLHLIYTKFTANKRQSLYDMVFDSNGNYKLNQIISIDIKYAYFPNQGIQLDANSLLMPCTKNGKTALTKLTIN